MKIVIIGGGITGLSAAYELAKAKRRGLRFEYCLIERAARTGGKILTDRDAYFPIEAGPDSFLTSKPNAVELCEELGLSSQLLDTGRTSQSVGILNNGRLKPIPEGMNFMVPRRLAPFLTTGLLSWPSKLRVLMDIVLPRGRPDDDESAAQFFNRRMGCEMTSTFIDPFCSGVYAGSAGELSFKSAFPILYRLQAKHRSLILGLIKEQRSNGAGRASAHTPFVTLKNGLDALPAAVASRLESQSVILGTQVKAVRREGGGYGVVLEDGRVIFADVVLAATPAFESARMIEELDRDLAAELSGIPYVSSATVTMIFKNDDFPRPARGFGFLVTRHEGKAILGATYCSNKFPGRAHPDYAAIRCFVGGEVAKELLRLDDQAVAERVLSDLRPLFEACGRPLMTKIYRWMSGNPVYAVGHEARLERIETRLRRQPGLFVAGAAYRGIGLPDCIAQGRQAASKILKIIEEKRLSSGPR
ncbi:MAG: protoporphyrinogen oxidase [Elusimicrobia bacterium]|nr:protoporphyrinogen oxidase [Elusimicrobiota bacterium]